MPVDVGGAGHAADSCWYEDRNADSDIARILVVDRFDHVWREALRGEATIDFFGRASNCSSLRGHGGCRRAHGAVSADAEIESGDFRIVEEIGSAADERDTT